jgi:hypothetical protein
VSLKSTHRVLPSLSNSTDTMGVAVIDRVARDLLEALNDEDLCDVSLISADGCPVLANRFVLAARCPVLKRMLYGSFREAKSSSICLLAYESSILRAVVEFCTSNEVRRFSAHLTPTEASVRQLVHLTKAADFLGLPELEAKVCGLARSLMTEHPPLACAVWDEATPGSELSNYAQQIMECRPYVALDIFSGMAEEEARGGGVECLRGSRVIDLFTNPNIAAGESFLFQMLLRWFQPFVRKNSREAALEVARQCTLQIRLEDIDPRELLTPQMQSCPFVPQERIFAAVAKQALRASHDRVWKLHCRGRQSEERVLVEDAGTRDANGIYYHITGLENGDLYTKREVACGQQNV